MPAAGGLASANHLYKVARPNGLTLATFNGTLLFEQVSRPGKASNSSHRSLNMSVPWPGSPLSASSPRASGIASMDAWMASKTPVKIGGIGPGNLAPDNTPKILSVGHWPSRCTTSQGTRERPRSGWPSRGTRFRGASSAGSRQVATWRKDLESGNAFVAVQAVPKVLPDLPKVPLAIQYAKTDEARTLIEAGIHSDFSRPFRDESRYPQKTGFEPCGRLSRKP